MAGATDNIDTQTEHDTKAKALEVYRVLLETRGDNPLVPRREPMRELVSTMLSHRTTHQNEERAYSQMWQRFGSWQGVRDAPSAELAKAIAPAKFPEVKAPNIQKTLAHIIETQGEATIDFLAEMPTGEALPWLTALPGVGVKTASLVLLFCFKKPVLPVDTHVHRVSGRLGLIGPKVSASAAHKLLLTLLPPEPQLLYNFHVNMLRHGQNPCVWQGPHCERCALQKLCDYYQQTH